VSILLGSERASSGLGRVGHMAFGVLYSALAGAVLAVLISGWWYCQSWQVHDWHAAKSYLMRSAGMPWDARGIRFLLNPDDLLSEAQRQRGMHATADHRKLDGYLIRHWRILYLPTIKRIGWFGFSGAVSSMTLYIFFILRLAGTAKRRNHRRGAHLVTPAELARLARKKGKPEFTFTEVKVPGTFTFRHTITMGTTGAGKSQFISSLLQQIRANGERALIYDSGGEFLSTFKSQNDVILNPFDSRSMPWNVLCEVINPWDADSVANSAIQKSATGNDNEYFHDGARKVLAEALKKLSGTGADMPEIYALLATSPVSELHKWFVGTAAATYLDPNAKNQGPGIQSTLTNKIYAWQYLSGGANSFSIREWVKDYSGWLFLTSREDSYASLEPLISLWIETAVTELLCRKSNQSERIWIIIDELASLQKLPSLLRVLSMGRKYRAAVVLATQTPSQLSQIYGREGAAALLGTVGNRLIFRLEDAGDAEAAARFFGVAEIEERRASFNMGSRQQGSNLNEIREQEQIVLASQIQGLPDLECYLKLTHGLPPAKSKQKYIPRQQISEPFILRNFAKKPQTSVNNRVLTNGQSEPVKTTKSGKFEELF